MRPPDTRHPGRFRPALERILDLLLPTVCLLCRGAAHGGTLCRGCMADLPRCHPACISCARPLAAEPGASVLCGFCQSRPPAWDVALPTLHYDYPVDRLVQSLKYHRDLAAGRALADAMLRCARPGSGWLVPVPLHRWRQCRRGFNQAAVLSAHLARASGLRHVPGALRRKRATPPQTGLSAGARQRNLRDAFVWRGPALDGQPITLVDDVMTTGSTLAACARVLRAAGSGPLTVWVAARAD